MKPKSISFVYVLALLLGFQSYIHAQCPVGAIIDQTSIPNATFGVAYSQQMTGSNFASSLTWSVAPALPGGLTISASGLISGTPIAGSVPSNYTIIATQTVGTCVRTQAVNFKINCPSLTFLPSASIPNARNGAPYNLTIVTGSTTCTITPALPAGLSLSLSGVLSGTPTTNIPPNNYTVTAGGSGGCSSGNVFNFAVTCPLGITTPPPIAYVGVPYSHNLGVTPIANYGTPNPALPAGLTLDFTGLISGTPTAAASTVYTVDVFLTPFSCNISAAPFNFIVQACPSASITSAVPANANIFIPYSHTFTSNYSGATTFSITPALSAPLNFTLNPSTDVMSGTPSGGVIGVSYVVRATQTATGCSTTQNFSLGASCPTTTITSAIPVATANLGTPYTHTFTTSLASATFTISPTTLPAGITFNTNTGVLSGTATAGLASTPYTVQAVRGGCGSSVQNFNFEVACPTITVSSTIPTSNFEIPFSSFISYTFSTTGGAGAISYALTGAPPTGITLNASTGVLTGSATVTGFGFFTVTATRGGCTSSITYNYWICNPTITIAPATLPTIPVVGVAYLHQPSVGYSSGSNVWSVSPALPAGLTIDISTGLISGMPTSVTASNSYVITVTNTTGGFRVCSTTRTYTFAVNCPTASITPATIPNATLNTAYSQQLTQTGVTGAVAWLVSPALPAGLTIDMNTGLISGTATATTTTANYVVAATNGTCGTTRTYAFAVNAVPCPTIIISPPSLLDPIINVPYSQQLTQTGLTAPVTWSVAPAFPPGITLGASTGLISGTATALRPNASYIVTVASGTCNADANFIFAVICPTRSITTATIPNATVNVAYNQQLSQTGVTGTVTWSVSPALPAGIALGASTGLISGTTTATSASASYVVTASNGTCSATITYPFAVTAVACPTSSITPATIPSGVVNVAYSQQLAQTGLTGTITWSVSPALPAGIALGASTGLISGTATAASASASYVVTTSNGTCSVTRSYTFVIVAATNPATSIDNSLASLVKVSPNPSNSDFNVDFGSINMVKSVVRVYDAQGKTVFSAENNSNLMIIPLAKFANGIYLMEVETSKGRILKRLAKQ